MHTHVHVHTHTYTRACMHTQYGYSAVDLAACNGHKDVVELLLDLKADPEVTDEEILTCIATCKVRNNCMLRWKAVISL